MAQPALLNEFRLQYNRLDNEVREAFASVADTVVLERLSDRLSEYLHVLSAVCSPHSSCYLY